MSKKTNYTNGNLFKRHIPKMPEGYYSGDKPNPNLRAFVEQHIKERPYDPETDDYDVPAFDKPIETTKATAIYNMHTYWSKKPHDAIRQYIRHYTKPGDLVLDPFCGSGGTALAALMEGRKAIAIDRSPAATFITKNYCTPVNVDGLESAFEDLTRNVKPEIDWLYETRCDRCGGKAITGYTVYSQIFECPRCMEKVTLFDCAEVEGCTAAGKPKKVNVCPHCYKKGHEEEINESCDRSTFLPVLVSYLCETGCRPARGERRHNDSNRKKREYFERYDLGKLKEIDRKKIPHWYPANRMMNAPNHVRRWAVLWRPYLGDRATVADFFRPRNLWALSCVLQAIESLSSAEILKDALKFAFSSSLLNASDMYRYRESGKGGLSMGTFYVGPVFQVMNAWRGFEDKMQDLLRGYEQLQLKNYQLLVSTESVTDLSQLPANSIDHIFTDPPYSWKVQYGESNFIWESWLRLDTRWHDEEIIVNEVRAKTETDWTNMMRLALSECFRVLKPGRWLALCYHDTSEGTWAIVQDLIAEAGLIPDTSESALYIDTGQKAWKQIVADKINKRDLVINFRKPKPGEVTAIIAITGEEDEITFNDKVRLIIREFLGANPGCTKDRIYDEVVSRMVRSGKMEAHDFDELLGQVAEEAKVEREKGQGGRWYLKETELTILDAAETTREDQAAERLGKFMKEHLKKHPGNEGVHYSDLFEHYVYAVKDKPRRQLADFLPDYFYKTEVGTWRLPASEEEEHAKREARTKGLGRQVKRYIAQLELGAAIPEKERPSDATLAEWIRHCKRAGLYEQGKLLYEKGGLNPGNLLEEATVNVDEDYQVCVRMLARSGGGGEEKKSKRGRRKKSEGEE